jgi:hypothetical protein
MSEVWGQAWMSVAPTGTGMSAIGPMIVIVLLPTSVLPLTRILKSVLPLRSALLIKKVMLIAIGKMVSIRTRKVPTGKSG